MDNVLQKIERYKLIPVVTIPRLEEAESMLGALCRGGLPVAEICFRTECAEEAIGLAVKKYPAMLVGAGTVLNGEQCERAIGAGAKFIVAPSLNPETIRLCNRYCVLCIPGIGSATELQQALELGAGLVKLFPGDVFKPAGLKAFKGPFPQADIMPTGGVSADNAEEWFKAGAVAVGAGSFLTAGAKKGDYEEVKRTARAFADKVARIKGGAR